MKSKSTFGKFLLGAALCAATVLLATSPTHAALIFTENFNPNPAFEVNLPS
jgi:hypothetical protein